MRRFSLHTLFRVCQVGDFGLRMEGPSTHAILPVDISLNGASYLVVVGAPNRHPPYRIENRCLLPCKALGSGPRCYQLQVVVLRSVCRGS